MTTTTPDLSQKTLLVTGATNGIGLEASVKLARMGAHVVMVGRDPGKTERVVAEVKDRAKSEKVSHLLADFSSLAAVRALAHEAKVRYPRIDVLVNNAGGVSLGQHKTEDGFEQTWAVNHLAPFLLTNLLLDVLEKSAPSRVVNTASVVHFRADLDLDDPGFDKGGYGIMKAYNRSKLANVLFTLELARRLQGKGVTANCLHPGVVGTGLWNVGPKILRPVTGLAKLFMMTPEKASGTIVYLASSPEVEGKSGGYYDKNVARNPSRLARDEELAKRLWAKSAEMVGLA